jgi:hypothetical protein
LARGKSNDNLLLFNVYGRDDITNIVLSHVDIPRLSFDKN